MKNLLTRTASGIVFLGIFLTALLWHPLAYGIIFTAVVLIMTGEYLHITLGGREKAAGVISLLLGGAVFLLTFLHVGYGLDGRWLLTLPVGVTLLYTALLYCRDRDGYGSTPFAVSALFYIAVPFALTNLIAFDPEGNFNGTILLAVMIIIWCSDVGAYLSGITFGRKHGHRLFPSISPNKSWEGYFGGLLLALVSGWVLQRTGMIALPRYHAVLLALVVNVSSTFGDLAESQLKRNFGVKDAGKIMPGHGGLLDRFDGALFAFPAAVLYILLFSI